MLTQDEINTQEYADPANWHHTLYASKKDSRIVVPKKTGLHGITVNFAKPMGVLIHVFIIGILTAAVVYVYCTFICKA